MTTPNNEQGRSHAERPLRLMIYDRTCRGRPALPGLSHAWSAGGCLYRGLGRIDAWYGARTWEEALHWLAHVQPGRRIAEIQCWSHGKWGSARMADDRLDLASMQREHPLRPLLEDVRRRLDERENALWWFRTCETFGAKPGHAFAVAFSDFLRCRVAGHTFIIGHWQSGLHSLAPGQTPTWSVEEGLREGSPEEPKRAHWSKLGAPNTLSFLHGTIPAGW